MSFSNPNNISIGCPVAILCIAITAAPAAAQTAEDLTLEERLEALERQNAQLRNEIETLKAYLPDTVDPTPSQASAPPRPNRTAASEGAGQAEQAGDGTTFEFGGYIKADALVSGYSDGLPDDDAREFYFPSRIPVAEGEATGSTSATDFTANQTRLNLTVSSRVADQAIKGFVEADFYGGGGNEIISNSVSPRLRHAYVEVNERWLFGQTWTNFMDLEAYPETLDFTGPAESIAFGRQAQVRYSFGDFSVALENPETTFEAQPDALSEDLPDLTVNYTMSTRFGHVGLGGVLREVHVENAAPENDAGISESAIGYGLRLSGRYRLGSSRDDIRVSAIYGDGLGRYVGIGVVPAGYINPDGSLETIPYVAGYFAIKHHWSEDWRSNLVLGTIQIDNADDQSATANRDASSVHANLLWSPFDALTLGIEYIYATRALKSGAEGSLNRLQFSTKYLF